MKKIAIVLAVFLLSWGYLERTQLISWYRDVVPASLPTEQPRPTASTSEVPGTPGASTSPKPTAGAAKSVVNLAVQFFSQAPRGDWSLPWQEACEEASAILVGAYWSGETLTLASMEDHIRAAVAWQVERFGFYEETTSQQTADMLKALYGFSRVDVEYDAGVSRIAVHLRAGRPVIVPLAGRMLGNPYYTAPGPIYHMLVVKGITADGDLITQDVGTRHGRDFVYSPEVFEAAMHDAPQGGATWPAGVDPEQYIKTGRKAMIVVYPN